MCTSNNFVGINRESSVVDQNIGQYIEDYIDLVENVPNEIVRYVTQLHERNHMYHKLLCKLEKNVNKYISSRSSTQEEQTKMTETIHNFLVHIQFVSDEKLNLIQSIYDKLEMKGRQLDFDLRNLKNGHQLSREISSREADFLSFVASSQAVLPNGKKVHDSGNNRKSSYVVDIPLVNGHHPQPEMDFDSTSCSPDNNRTESNIKTSGSRRKQAFRRNGRVNGHVSKKSDIDIRLTSSPVHGSPPKNGRGIKRHNSAGRATVVRGSSSQSSRRSKRDTSPPSIYEEPNPVDPDEPTYCLCGQISYGEMICCDNTNCSLEWFHFQCVQLATKPKGKWYCPQCRGDRSNLPKK